jgi:hypothetical protein
MPALQIFVLVYRNLSHDPATPATMRATPTTRVPGSASWARENDGGFAGIAGVVRVGNGGGGDNEKEVWVGEQTSKRIT